MYGRYWAGVSSTTATHQPELTTSTTSASSSCRTRRHSPVGANSRYARPKAGSTRNACRVLVRKAKPTQAAASTSHRVRACSWARCTA